MVADDILEFAEDLKEIKILDEQGAVMLSSNNYQYFFEASWIHKYNGKFYFSYSMQESNFIFYAIGDKPYGAFTYKGRIFNPFAGRNLNHSIYQLDNEWYLFYHDSIFLTSIQDLRNIKCIKIDYMKNGKIVTIDSYGIRRVAE